MAGLAGLLVLGTVAAAAAAPVATAEARVRCAAEAVAVRTDRSVETLEAYGLCEIDRRLATLDRLADAIDEAEAISADHRAALERILATTETTLRTIRAEIVASGDERELTRLVRSIATETRVYVLVVPQVWLVRGADVGEAAVDRLETAVVEIGEAIEIARAAGLDVTEAAAHLAAMEAATARAAGHLNGLAASVVPLTPADWNAGPAGPIVREARADLGLAGTTLREALREARAALAALR
jgi:hypothetical protein